MTVWDAWRPDRVQMELWKAFPAERFVSVPLGMGGVGSAHSRGVAFDVTLCSEDGGFLAMPTGFDDFNSPLANPKASGSGPEFERRDLLQEAMAGAGFLGADSEWWHFQLAGWEGFGVVECDWNKMPVDGEGRMSPR